ncbi:hypothetical protein ACIQTZ_22380 [Paenarthrobacter sp. NPDC090520]|uniref:hypothetical protein n=1 Tax=Paenarthrobacter sp. NPDC090520 TaxID=3364382 RepID=UPI00382E4684
MRNDVGSAWILITQDTILRATVATEPPVPVWEGSSLRRTLLMRRAIALLVIGTVTALLGWSVIVGVRHAMDEYTTVEARVTKQEDTSSRRSASCRLHVSYAVSDQQLQGVAGVNAGCGTLP